MAQKITPNLWCDGNAKEMADFYTAAFDDGEITHVQYYPKTKEEGLADFQLDMAGKELVVAFKVGGMDFVGINAGPEFKLNPSISFLLNFDPSKDDQAEEHLNALWDKLIVGGEAMMELGEYPHSKRYGWLKDKFGLTWQLMLTNGDGEPRPFMTPCLMFVGDKNGKAEEAMKYYVSIFEDTQAGNQMAYPQDGPNDIKAGMLMYADFTLNGEWFAVMDGGTQHDFTFNEAVSLSIDCKDQEEIDYFWDKLSKVPESEQCGWCKDQYGVSWQVVPQNMGELLSRPDGYKHMMDMHKLVIADF